MNKSSFFVGLIALASGALFGFGLVISGMADPAKVLGFLNIAGLRNGISWTAQSGMWDPSLALVMGGALAVTVPGFAWFSKRNQAPLQAVKFDTPTASAIDTPLMLGATLFGLGWGLAGYCPGPALASAFLGGADVWLFGAAMLGAMVLTHKMLQRRSA